MRRMLGMLGVLEFLVWVAHQCPPSLWPIDD
jgi:hypothetical protein